MTDLAVRLLADGYRAVERDRAARGGDSATWVDDRSDRDRETLEVIQEEVLRA